MSSDVENFEFVDADDDSECTSSLEYDATDILCGTPPPHPRAERRLKAQSLRLKVSVQERTIMAHMDKQQQQKKRDVQSTKSRSFSRSEKLQFADADSSAQVHSNMKVDTHSRIMCLNPTPVTKQDDSLPETDHQPVSRPVISLVATESGCPSDRYDFYQTFSTLIRLGSAPKKEKDLKGSSLFGANPYSRQLSTEQELWQTHLCDLIWFELQAYVNARTNKDQDDFLLKARDGISCTLEQVMSFSAANVPTTNGLQSECFCSKWQSGYSGACLQQVVRRQCAVSKMVIHVLEDVENAESLYPTQKSLAVEHPVYAENKFQRRIATLCLWITVTRDIAQKIKLMSELVNISDQSLIGTAWSCIDLHSLRLLALGCFGNDVSTEQDCHSVVFEQPVSCDEDDSAMSENSSDCSHPLSVPPPPGVQRQKSVHFEDEQQCRGTDPSESCSDQPQRRIGRPTSMEVTPTSIYRLYVDAALKKTGLRKLRVRLKELLDTTLQRARLALLPAGCNTQQAISNVSKVLFCSIFSFFC